ncbi:unnamed protein product [Porites evermanni]|uniref:Uncharacterized protein n=1 Tax=Porites evermanni TaxID=104178 RepID=A0ABN8LFK9_9CNID|nr:unnamed protein product [Porites evermanni]
MSKSKFVKFENSVKRALGDCKKSAGLGAKFLREISKSHSSSRDYWQGQGNWRVSALVDKLNKQPTHVECGRIKRMINKVDKGVLLTIPNPKYEQLINRYHHLQQLVTDDNDKNSELLIHVILGSSEYSGIKTATKPQEVPCSNVFFCLQFFFQSGWGSDSATGNIVTQYYLPHGWSACALAPPPALCW